MNKTLCYENFILANYHYLAIENFVLAPECKAQHAYHSHKSTLNMVKQIWTNLNSSLCNPSYQANLFNQSIILLLRQYPQLGQAQWCNSRKVSNSKLLRVVQDINRPPGMLVFMGKRSTQRDASLGDSWRLLLWGPNGQNVGGYPTGKEAHEQNALERALVLTPGTDRVTKSADKQVVFCEVLYRQAQRFQSLFRILLPASEGNAVVKHYN